MTRVLLFSTLFPNAADPNHGVFVENRLRATLLEADIEATVLAPVPYFPFGQRIFGRYAAFARAPRYELRHGVEVWHPRFPVAPKIGTAWTPGALFRAGLAFARRRRQAGQSFDVIDAHYFYPDGVAAARLGLALQAPVVITGRGTDLTLLPEDDRVRREISWAAREASATIAVCEDLMRRLVALGAPPERAFVVRNGVDLARFAPRDRAAARAALGLSGFTLLSTGSLIPRKGHDLVIEALARHPDCTLLIAGSGPERRSLEALARRLGVAGRVRFLGEISHAELPAVYAAADVLVLASSREGWANVLLEAMACGTPVIATDVNGTREVVRSPEVGILVGKRTAAAVAEAVRRFRQSPLNRADTRRYAENFGWNHVGQANGALLRAVAAAGFGGRHAPGVLDPARRLLGGLEAAA